MSSRERRWRWGRRKHDVRYALMMIVALVATYGAWQAHQTATSGTSRNLREIQSNQQKIVRLVAANRLALLEGCERLNIQRAETNEGAYADFLMYQVVLRETQVVTSLSASQRRYRKLFLAPLEAAVRAKEWTPLTDCKQAVNADGVRYRSPLPVPFVVRLPPPSALAIP